MAFGSPTRYRPNGGASDPAHVIKPGRRDHFGDGDQVAGKLGIPAHEHRNGGRHPLPPRLR
jgi:hypothetical protein